MKMLFTQMMRSIHSSDFRLIKWTDVSALLRPFYLKVHPDMFMNFPKERRTNEDSLKNMNLYLETLTRTRTRENKTLDFFVKQNGSSKLKRLTIDLQSSRGLMETLKHILKSVDLPSDIITLNSTDAEATNPQEDEYGYRRSGDSFWTLHHDELNNFRGPAEKVTLRQFLEENAEIALERSRMAKPLYEEAMRVEEQIVATLGLKQITWGCGWRIVHYRAGLRALLNLQEHHPEIRVLLKGRILVFDQLTGVSLEGSIILSTADVRHHWLSFLRDVNKQFGYVERVPHMERLLSEVLRGIKISHGSRHARTLAYSYLIQVEKLTKIMQRWLWMNRFPPELPWDLSQFRLHVENEAGPLMVSHKGDFIVPASCTAELLVEFLVNNLELAKTASASHQIYVIEEERLRQQVIWKLGLRELSKDETISSQTMAKCLQALLDESENLSILLHDCHLRVSDSYSLISDGILCIPADWSG